MNAAVEAILRDPRVTPVPNVTYFGRVVLPIENIKTAASRGLQFAGLKRMPGHMSYARGLVRASASLCKDIDLMPPEMLDQMHPYFAISTLQVDENLISLTERQLEAADVFVEWELAIRFGSRDSLHEGVQLEFDSLNQRLDYVSDDEMEVFTKLHHKILAEKKRRTPCAQAVPEPALANDCVS